MSVSQSREPFVRRSAKSSLLIACLFSTSLARSQYVPDAPTQAPNDAGGSLQTVPELASSMGYHIPPVGLEVPSGRRGLTPAISIGYSPSHPNGTMGAGWSIQGLSRIDRVSRTHGLDTADETSGSRFFVDGTELMRESDGTFRRLQDDFTVFRRQRSTRAGEQWSGRCGWTTTKEGVRESYGWVARGEPNNAALFSASVSYEGEGVVGGRSPASWLLSRTVDEFHNYIAYKYFVPSLGGSVPSGRHIIRRIDYGNSTKDASYSMRFKYRDRPDSRVAYEIGLKRVEAFLLDEIEVFAIDGPNRWLISKYRFTYQESENDDQSILKRIETSRGKPRRQLRRRSRYAEGVHIRGHSKCLEPAGQCSPD